MDERAVAPVVAAMLLLVVLVTFLSAYNAVVVPSFKQQAEVEHLHAVEESFLAFGSDMTTAAALKRDLQLSKRIPLGGGETGLDPVRSAGTLRVDGGDTLARVTLNGAPPYYYCNLTNFSYTPNGNFWRDQGYVWQYGYTNVTGAGGLQTPLDYADMGRIRADAADSGFARSLIDIEHEGAGSCTGVTITLVTFEPGEHTLASGSGVATLSLDVSVEEERIVSPNGIEIAVNTTRPVPLNASLWTKCNATFHAMNETYNNIKDCTTIPDDSGWGRVALTFNEDAPDVTLRLIRIAVSAR